MDIGKQNLIHIWIAENNNIEPFVQRKTGTRAGNQETKAANDENGEDLDIDNI